MDLFYFAVKENEREQLLAQNGILPNGLSWTEIYCIKQASSLHSNPLSSSPLHDQNIILSNGGAQRFNTCLTNK